MPALTPASEHKLHIWSQENHPTMPDLFELEDGRQVKISHAAEVDAERTRYAVTIQTKGWEHRATYGEAHKHCPGYAGFLYLHRDSGAWQLLPVERTVSSCPRGTFESHHISCAAQATKRQAALELIDLSDQLQRLSFAWYQATGTQKAGDWLITPLAKHADCLDLTQAPNSVRLDHDRIRHYVAAHPKHGSIRCIAERLETSNGYVMHCRVIPSPNLHSCTGKVQAIPKRIERWIESRIRSV